MVFFIAVQILPGRPGRLRERHPSRASSRRGGADAESAAVHHGSLLPRLRDDRHQAVCYLLKGMGSGRGTS